jgi:hypothetical protein
MLSSLSSEANTQPKKKLSIVRNGKIVQTEKYVEKFGGIKTG